MAGASLLALLDDIATILDDIAVMTKASAGKAAGVLGDDLALNAQQVRGVRAERELPVVGAVALGSLKNKAILVPAALAISAIAPWIVSPLLMLGGAYLCVEGFEKIAHMLLHRGAEQRRVELAEAIANPAVDLVEFERSRIRGAIRTDFVLSAEIVVITLGTVAAATFGVQVTVLVAMALLMTLGVYGLVAMIVKLDDAGIWLMQRHGKGSWRAAQRWAGRHIVLAAPWLMKALAVVGTAAMFLVGGGIIVHGLPWLGALVHGAEHEVELIPAVGDILADLTVILLNGLVGVLVGALVFAVLNLGRGWLSTNR